MKAYRTVGKGHIWEAKKKKTSSGETEGGGGETQEEKNLMKQPPQSRQEIQRWSYCRLTLICLFSKHSQNKKLFLLSFSHFSVSCPIVRTLCKVVCHTLAQSLRNGCKSRTSPSVQLNEQSNTQCKTGKKKL